MKFKNIFFVVYSVTVLYCYNVFAFKESEQSSMWKLTFNDGILIGILIVLAVIFIKGFKIKKGIQE